MYYKYKIFGGKKKCKSHLGCVLESVNVQRNFAYIGRVARGYVPLSMFSFFCVLVLIFFVVVVVVQVKSYSEKNIIIF